MNDHYDGYRRGGDDLSKDDSTQGNHSGEGNSREAALSGENSQESGISFEGADNGMSTSFSAEPEQMPPQEKQVYGQPGPQPNSPVQTTPGQPAVPPAAPQQPYSGAGWQQVPTSPAAMPWPPQPSQPQQPPYYQGQQQNPNNSPYPPYQQSNYNYSGGPVPGQPTQPQQSPYWSDQQAGPAWQQPSQPSPKQDKKAEIEAKRMSGEGYQWDYNQFETFGSEPRKTKTKNKGVLPFLLILFLCLILVGGGFAGLYYSIPPSSGTSIPEASSLPDAQAPPADSDVPSGEVNPGSGTGGEDMPPLTTGVKPESEEVREPLVGELMTIPQVAKAVTPSVVGIMRYEGNRYQATGLGSGVIISADETQGYIITNAHVVTSGTDFLVQLYDTTKYDATLVGMDTQSDLAVLRIEAEGLVPAVLGDSDELEVGETVIAIGNPVSLELSGSVTQGIVSAVNRKISASGATMNFIQTDAAINPGNSGGALANQYGQLVGINTMKVTATGYEGIGFAIPITEAIPIVTDLVENGKVTTRPMLGITGEIIDESRARDLGSPMGILVQSVAENALIEPELLPNDIITHIGEERIYTLTDLRDQLAEYEIGDTVELTVYRKVTTVRDEELTVTVTLIGG